MDRLTRDLLDPIGALEPRAWEKVPVFGGMLEQARWSRTASPIVARIEAVLEAREPVPIGVWGDDPTIRRVAAVTLKAIGENMGWTNTRFRPGDDAEVAFWAWDDGLDVEFTLWELGDALGLDLSDEDAWNAMRGTLGGFVARLVLLGAS